VQHRTANVVTLVKVESKKCVVVVVVVVVVVGGSDGGWLWLQNDGDQQW
jgi:hypothetical protein